MNSIEKRIEIALKSIEINKNRKKRREKAEEKLRMLIELRDIVIPMQEEKKLAEKNRQREESKERQRERAREKSRKQYWKDRTPTYKNNQAEREPRENDLYTLEELMNPPEGETGRINWEVWWRTINEFRQRYQ